MQIREIKAHAGASTVIHTEPPRYRAFMLRCWEVRSADPGGPGTWRFSLEDPETRRKLGFADLDMLVIFLSEELGGAPDQVGVSSSS